MATDPEKKRQKEERERRRRERAIGSRQRDRVAGQAEVQRRGAAEARRQERAQEREEAGKGPSLGRRLLTSLTDMVVGPPPTPALRGFQPDIWAEYGLPPTPEAT